MKMQFIIILCCLVAVGGCSSSNDGDSDGTNTTGTNTNRTFLRLSSNSFVSSDGTVGMTITKYGQNGYLVDQDISENGELVRSVSYEHDSLGRFTRASSDFDQDGIEDRFSTYVYDDVLGLSRIYRHGIDTLIDSVIVYSFEGGLAVSRKFYNVDDLVDGNQFDVAAAELRIRRTFEYENGRLSAILRDSDADGVMDFRQDFSYNPDGTLSTSSSTNIAESTSAASSYVYEAGACTTSNGNSATAFFCVESSTVEN